MLTLAEICQATGARLIGNDSVSVIRSFHFDTRLLSSGSMFIALTGGARDGHLFLKEARQQGAVAALISDPGYISKEVPLAYVLVEDTQLAFADLARYYRKKLSIPVIAVTGSNGKTTTKDMIAHVLGSKKKVCKTYKNYNNHLGVPLSILQITPEHELAVLEMGMNHAGEIDFLASIAKPDISVIVNVTDAHIEHLGSKENIARAKAELLPHTSKDGFAILNGDNPYVMDISRLNPGKTFFFRLHQPADIYADRIQTNDQGTSYRVHVDGNSIDCSIPLFGTHNVANSLPAIYIAYRLGYPLPDIAASLASMSISPMRFELVKEIKDTLIINDAYNASPTSMKSSIETFAAILPDYKKVLVLGDMFELGKESQRFHAEVGQWIESLADHFEQVITVGNDSRHIASAVSSIPARHFAEKEAAAPVLSALADHEHAFLFKASRGMKLEELIRIIAGS